MLYTTTTIHTASIEAHRRRVQLLKYLNCEYHSYVWPESRDYHILTSKITNKVSTFIKISRDKFLKNVALTNS